ncbi:hypothetical protein [Wielerella bovis]|uniref:hypothetical protein n=1 Tax=Wielerella bovis TaxID=2917790 RepID=UPI0020199EAF|nr:hypothetical protein [Wielerella bovis]ULJ60812.1 hypothetical protein MIS44_02820 [Wielerella bovis]ULJ68154.1 hypothetical protein MIS31_06395 [Wielerella bovis]
MKSYQHEQLARVLSIVEYIGLENDCFAFANLTVVRGNMRLMIEIGDADGDCEEIGFSELTEANLDAALAWTLTKQQELFRKGYIA